MKQYEENGYLVTEYDSGAVVKTLITEEPQPISISQQPTLEEIQAQILLNTEYLAVMQELKNM